MNDIRPPQPQTPTQPPRQIPSRPAPLSAPERFSPPATSSPQPPLLELPQKPRRRWIKWVIALIVLLAVLLIGAAVAGYYWYTDALEARSTTPQQIEVEVASGTSAEALTTALEQKGVIKSSLALLIYMKLNGSDFKAGHYVLSPDQPTVEVLQWLREGRVNTKKVTILPGKTLADIKQELVKAGFTAAAVDAALAKSYTHPLLNDKPKESSLEGYIFPETYFMNASDGPEAVLLRSFDEFEKRLQQKKLREGLKTRSFSLHQGVILASLVSGEVPGFEDRRQVAQVFEKRLRDDIELGSDVSYVYAARLLGLEPSPSIDSPYNTRKYKGLPPGPVSNFNLDALEAVANPASGDFLYFVSGDDGTTYFSHTFAEHEENIKKYCTKLCSSN